jgi:CDP-diacylglycerol--glycerol-3-phosphate 3-phosphatidyltransferase
MFLTIPTLLTWARIAAIPLIIGVFYLGWDMATKNLVATTLFVLFAITDWLDGWLARRLNQTSAFGAFLDPVADKFLICATLLVLLEQGRVEALVALIIIGREIAISALREWMAEIGARHKMKVSGIGKFKTIVQIVGLSMMLFREDLFGLPVYQFGLGLTVLAAVLTLWSMAAYLNAAGPDLRSSGQT